MSEFSCERAIKKTRKTHVCEHCKQKIEIGGPAQMLSGVWDGDFSSVYMHEDCCHVGRLYAEMTGYWGDEWMWLHQLEEAADHDWLRVNHPDVYARLRTSAIPT